MNNLSIVILAAGQGKRMKSALPKVLHRLGGKPLLRHVVDAAMGLAPSQVIVVHGHGGDQIQAALSDLSLTWVYQAEQLGTGHAVMQALPHIPAGHRVLILCGDVPLIRTDTLDDFLKEIKHVGVITASFEDPTGFGRIIRDKQDHVLRIVEQKDATPEQQAITEINSGIYTVLVEHLKRWLPAVKNKNSQNEFYLTDIVSMAVAEKIPVQAYEIDSDVEVRGVNDRRQLSELEADYQDVQAERLMMAGLGLMDPNRFDLRGDLSFGQDVVIDINVIIEGKVVLGDRCTIGPNVILKNVMIGNDVEVKAGSILEDSTVGDACTVGPYARLRPGTVLSRDVRVGNFVELKKSVVGVGSKIPHLSYVGDATIGERVNIGAGTITCNYDGINKHQTIIHDGAFVGSNVNLVAPMTVGENALIGAGSTVRREVPANKITVERSEQVSWDKK